jgi:hypothetical protein
MSLLACVTGWVIRKSESKAFQNDGATIYKLRLEDVSVYGFWSISLYNGMVTFRRTSTTLIR